MERGPSTVEEVWSAAKGGTMIGYSRIVRGERTSMFEFLRIEVRDGKLVYIAQPRGNPPTEFVATKATADEVVFENPRHDDPKKISYRRGDGALTAVAEGERTLTFAYKRSACAGN